MKKAPADEYVEKLRLYLKVVKLKFGEMEIKQDRFCILMNVLRVQFD